MREPIVEEVQGLYGPFIVSEKILHRVWAQGDFYREGLRTVSGKSLEVLRPGRWNTNEGPDFREARLRIDGREVTGDVEIHFRARDWLAHGHDRNPNFGRVKLHVLLYAPDDETGELVAGAETLVLLPQLNRDLEDYAMEEALLDLENAHQQAWFEAFVELPADERARELLRRADLRWARKLGFARKRLERGGWEAACHQTALEALGYARNRAPMSRIAERHSLAEFAGGLDADGVFASDAETWKLSGARPANHPKRRLAAYSDICRKRPDWPERLSGLLEPAGRPVKGLSVSAFRKAAGTRALLNRIAEEVFSCRIGEKRLNTLLCDGIFPLAGARGMGAASDCWLCWYPGDLPDALLRLARRPDLLEGPLANGLLQGLLSLSLSAGAR